MSKLDRVIAADLQNHASAALSDAAGLAAWSRPELIRIDRASPRAEQARAAFAARSQSEQR